MKYQVRNNTTEEILAQFLCLENAKSFAEHISKNPVSDSDVKKEYDRQLALLGEPGQIMEYRVRIAVLPTDAEAKAVLARIRKGESFEKVAKEKSRDRSKDQGGLLDWMLPNQMIPAVSNVVVNLSKGALSAVPLRTPAGWTVLKVEDTRQFKPPSLDESKDRIRNALTQQKRAEFIRGLRASAKVVQ
jgi:peptidyl-prolyl cis-trans isomerase C